MVHGVLASYFNESIAIEVANLHHSLHSSHAHQQETLSTYLCVVGMTVKSAEVVAAEVCTLLQTPPQVSAKVNRYMYGGGYHQGGKMHEG